MSKKAKDAIKDIVLNYDGRNEDGGEVGKLSREELEGEDNMGRPAAIAPNGRRRKRKKMVQPDPNIDPETGLPKSHEQLEYEKQMAEYLIKKVGLLFV